MALNLMCSNSKCVHYFEDNCIKHLNDERIILDENGKCETFEEGICEGYKFIGDEVEEKMSEEIDWCHSLNGEYFNSDSFETREECIADATKNYGYPSFYIGQAVRDFTPYINAEDVLDYISNQAYDENEYAEDYLSDVIDDHERELERELNDVLQKWLEKHPNYKPTFFTVENIEMIEVKEE